MSCSTLFFGSQNTCNKCIEDSLVAAGAVCTECADPKFYLDETDHLCKSCSERIPNCMWCQVKNCYRCQPEFYLYTDSTDSNYIKCIFCDQFSGCSDQTFIYEEFVSDGTGYFSVFVFEI